jgi:DNA mismatch endonuclease (patch repair protein)
MEGIPPERSHLMARVRGKNTGPEILVRKALHRAGLRFRLHSRNLPGRPDIVLPRLKIAIFVHGCFWHRHEGCKLSSDPKTRVEFWRSKFDANVARDRRNEEALSGLGWKVVTVWECQTRKAQSLAVLLAEALRTDEA